MTVFLDSLSNGPASSAHQTPIVDSVRKPTTEGEVPKINGATSIPKPGLNGTSHGHINGINTNGTDNTTDPFQLNRQYAYTPQKLKVFTIGAGFSGLLMAHKFQHRFPEMQDIVDHTIFEAHSEVGGTWLVNNYPGVQCDVPAHIYAFPFDPNPEWTRFYASGAEILAYFKRIVEKWNLGRDLQLNTKVIGAKWQEDLGQWKVTVEKDGVQRDEFCHVLISGQGVLV
jgi:hypothetical protein